MGQLFSVDRRSESNPDPQRESPDREDEVPSSSENEDSNVLLVSPADGALGTQGLLELLLRQRPIEGLLSENRDTASTAEESMIGNNESSDNLYWSAKAGDLHSCQTLLASGADVNHRTIVNDTPLHTASKNGRTPVVKLLIDKGAFVNITDQGGFTPLHFAAMEGHLATARLLVNSGARTDAAMTNGAMPIHSAAQYNRHQILTYLVTEAGVSVNVVSTYTKCN